MEMHLMCLNSCKLPTKSQNPVHKQTKIQRHSDLLGLSLQYGNCKFNLIWTEKNMGISVCLLELSGKKVRFGNFVTISFES